MRNLFTFAFITVLTLFSFGEAKADDRVHRLTPFSEVVKLPSPNGFDDGQPIDTYTRLEITRTDTNVADDPIKYNKRTFLYRLIAGKKYTSNITLKSEIGKFKATTPLLTREYESSSKSGESFIRDVSFDNFDFPLFLVSSDTRSSVGKFSLEVEMAETSKSNGLALSLSLLTKAIKTVAPTSGVLTTLTEQSTSDGAAALDSSINQLFATSVKEVSSFDVDLGSGDKYKLTLRGPVLELNELKPQKIFGEWIVGFSPPRPSIFSNVVACRTSDDPNATGCIEGLGNASQQAASYAIDRPHSVLSFELLDKVSELGSISSYLKQKDWWADKLKAIEANNPPYAAFCRQIRSAIADLGLNDLDGKIVSHAVANSEYVSNQAKQDMSAVTDCTF